MKITERRLRSLIKQVILESLDHSEESYGLSRRGEMLNIEEIKNAYFYHVHNNPNSYMSPEDWADKNLDMNMYSDNRIRSDVMRALKSVEMSPAHRMSSGR
tara:strand:- start:711 stop:1013 length:303 start_codon:yes stop_codon:yes gene_type:complete